MPSKRKEILSDNPVIKAKGLFDHVRHIRQDKTPDYYTSLSDRDEKSFNVYMILRILSMDETVIEEVAYISTYFEVIPKPQFYTMMIAVIPQSPRFFKYIKSTKKTPHATIIECITRKFSIGKRDAIDYYHLLRGNDVGRHELSELVRGFGYGDAEMKRIFK
jgi:hypothetical protein